MFLAFVECKNVFNTTSSNFNLIFIYTECILLLLFSCSEHPKYAGQHQAMLGIDPYMMEGVVFRITGNLKTAL